MISLKEFFKRNSKAHGSRLAKLVSTELCLSKEPCEIDFAQVSHLSPVFFQDFIFPLVLEFGSQTLIRRLKFANLQEQHLKAYAEACNQTTDYIDKLQPFQGVTIVFKLFFAWMEQALGREMGLLGIVSFLRWRFLGAARVFPVFFNVDMRRYAAQPLGKLIGRKRG